MYWPGSYIGWSPSLSRAPQWLALLSFDERFSGEKPWDFSLDENSPDFASGASRDRPRDLPFSVELRVVPTLLPVQPPRQVRMGRYWSSERLLNNTSKQARK